MVTEDPMVTLGVDLASQPKNTAICLIRWDGKFAHVEELRRDKSTGGDDEDLHRLFAQADKIGIDAPFGWPHSFTRALWDYSDPAKKSDWPGDADSLRYRRTDKFVLQEIGVRPLSVSSDLIAWTARRAARLLSTVSKKEGETVDRTGKFGRFVEVYPKAALSAWGLLPRDSYKGAKGKTERIKLMGRLRKSIPGLDELSDEHRQDCENSDDALDALVAALVARASALDPEQCELIPDDDRCCAREEGWIAIPKKESLDQLATG